MKIAQVAPLYESVPPRLYGGTERIVAYLADALVELGHDVVLFAAPGPGNRARLVPARDQALRLDPHPLKSVLAAHLSMLDEVRRRADEFDVLHFHVDMLHFPMFEAVAGKTLTTLHGRLDLKDLPRVYARWPQYALATLFPVDWPEPFGLVMIESLACGTPVIGWRCGSVPEVLEPGVTGAVVASLDEAVAAVSQAADLDRSRIRAEFERRFSATTMASRYLEIYRTLAPARRPAPLLEAV